MFESGFKLFLLSLGQKLLTKSVVPSQKLDKHSPIAFFAETRSELLRQTLCLQFCLCEVFEIKGVDERGYIYSVCKKKGQGSQECVKYWSIFGQLARLFHDRVIIFRF